MPTGTVKWFDSVKGFGFIQPDDGARDVFVHVRQLEASGLNGLLEKQKVSFDLQRDQRSGKDAAVNISVVS